MTVGITPTGPETGYGYLQCGPIDDSPVTVLEFKEKPTAVSGRSRSAKR